MASLIAILVVVVVVGCALRTSCFRFGPAALVATLLVGGCVVLHVGHTPQRLSVEEIVKMSQAHVPPDQIIARMRASGTIYRLTASQLARLHDQGVPDAVIDKMQRTYLTAVRHNQFLADEARWSLEPDGYWYGGLPYGWSPGWLGLSDDEEGYYPPAP